MIRVRPRKVLWIVVFFWFLGGGVITYRLLYDLRTAHFGTTLVIRGTEPGIYDYLLHFPKGYSDFGPPRPLLIFLHGAGEVGKDITEVRETLPLLEEKPHRPPESFPFIVVSPVTPQRGWEPYRVIYFLDHLLSDTRFRYRIDTNRIYLTGLSMGGFATFDIACEYPERFAAIVPLAGGGDPGGAEQLIMVPTWAFHSDGDPVVSFDSTSKMIDAMQNLHHPNVRFTVLHGAEHNITQEVYDKSELFEWLLQQSLANRKMNTEQK